MAQCSAGHFCSRSLTTELPFRTRDEYVNPVQDDQSKCVNRFQDDKEKTFPKNAEFACGKRRNRNPCYRLRVPRAPWDTAGHGTKSFFRKPWDKAISSL